MAEQLQLLVWASEVVSAAGNRVTLVARRPLSHMSCRQASKVLGCSEWTVSDLFRNGLLEGYKPGARVRRRDGRASNAALRLDSESVLLHKRRMQKEARFFTRE